MAPVGDLPSATTIQTRIKTMRRDMKKVICESRRRYGSSFSASRLRGTKSLSNDELFPTRVPMRRIHSSPKEFGENLTPLLKFLETNAGRNWNDVYSEIRESLKTKSTIDMHILIHLEQFVTITGLYVEDGEVWVLPRFNLWNRNYLAFDFCEFFVHPQTGILVSCAEHKAKRASERKKEKARKDAERARKFVKMGEASFAYKVNGVWQEFYLSPCVYPGGGVRPSCYYNDKELYGYAQRFFTSKQFTHNNLRTRTLSKKEIRNLKLNQEPK